MNRGSVQYNKLITHMKRTESAQLRIILWASSAALIGLGIAVALFVGSVKLLNELMK